MGRVMKNGVGLKVRARLVAAVALLGLVAVACNTAAPIAGVIGVPGKGSDSSDSLDSKLNRPEGVAIDLSGATYCDLYVADTANNRIRALPHFGIPGFTCSAFGNTQKEKIAAAHKGLIADKAAATAKAKTLGATSAGPLLPYGTDIATVGPTGRANTLNGPTGLAVDNLGEGPGDSWGDLYIADTGNSRIMKLTPPAFPTGKRDMSRVDRGGLKLPRGIAVLPDSGCFGNSDPMLLIADTGNNRIAMMNMYTGGVSTLMLGLNKPEGVTFDWVRCAVIVADTGNNQLIALHGNGWKEFIGSFNRPTAVAFDIGIAIETYYSLLAVSETGAHRIDYITNYSTIGPVTVPNLQPLCPGGWYIGWGVIDSVQGKLTQTTNTLFDPRGLDIFFGENWSADANQHVVSAFNGGP
jgi:DNA-binding beta-propeller fold protein YncE